MISQQLQPILTALHEQLGSDLVAVVLFGSRARGESQSHSDWDVLIIANSLPKGAFQRHLYLKSLLPPFWRGQISILAKTPTEFESHVPDLYLDIALDGIILYDTGDYVASRLAHLRQLIREQGLYRTHQGRDLIWRWRHFPGPGWRLTWEGVM